MWFTDSSLPSRVLSVFCALALLASCFPLPVRAATGDISAVRILANGWMAEIDIDGFKDGGAYDFGLGANNDPATAKVVFTVTSEGYDENGNLGTIARTVYGTQYIRKTYPNEAEKDEVEGAEKVTLKIALSDFVYNDDENGGVGTSGTDVTVSIASGFYTDSGTGGSGAGSAATSGLTVANSSTLDYPKVIGRWAWPGYERVTGNFLVEAVAFHRFARNGKPVAAVEFDATDESANTAATQTVTEMTKTTRTGDANQVLVYAATIPVVSLAQGDVIDVNFRAYPWVGDEDAVLDSSTGADGVAQPDERLGPLHQLNDKDGSYGVAYALVHPSGTTSTSTGASIYTSQAAAEAGGSTTAFSTIGRAAEAIKIYQATNFGRTSAGGGVILLAEGSYMFPGFAPTDLGDMDAWLTVTRASGADKADTIIGGGTNTVFNAKRLKVEDLTLSTTTSTNTFRGRSASDVLWLDDNTISMTQTAPIYAYKAAYATHNAISALSNGLTSFSTQKSPWALLRGNDSTPIISGALYATLGNHNIHPRFTEYDHAGGHQVSNNSIFAFNSIESFNNAITLAATSENDNDVAVVQNVLESLSATQPLLQIAADNSTSTANNVLIWHNTLAGQRANLGYNDTGTVGRDRLNWSQRFNSFNDWNNKDDTFGTQNANRTGGWPVGHNVGTIGNLSEQANFPGEFGGLSSDYSGTPAYADDNSGSSGIGNGTYTLTATSQGVDFATTTAHVEQPLPYDFAGNVFYGPPDSGAYEYIPPYAMGSDQVSTSTSVRLYGDEKFRNKATPSAAGTADLSVSIPGSDTGKWLDIDIATWDTGGDYQKTWTESTSRADVSDTVHTVGDLSPSTYYAVQVDGVTGASITGASCTAGVCLSNGSGEITFTYTGTYSSHEFNIIEGSDNVAPTIDGIAATTTATTATIEWTTDEAATSTVNYGLTASYGTASSSAVSTTSHETILTGLAPATAYHYQIGVWDAAGNLATSTDQTFTTAAASEDEEEEVSTSDGRHPGDRARTEAKREAATVASAREVVEQNIELFRWAQRYGLSLPPFVLEMLSNQPSSTSSATTIFTRDLSLDSAGEDVWALQQLLNVRGFAVAAAGPGAPGSETTIFGYATQAALIRLQAAHGIEPAHGYFGPLTRQKLTELGWID